MLYVNYFGHRCLPILAILTGFISCGCEDEPAYRRRITDEQVSKIRSGASCGLQNPFPSMLEEISKDTEVVKNLTILVISSEDVSSPDFSHLADFSKINVVSLYETRGTDALLDWLSECEDLTEISFDSRT
ncbi:MAG: hypothetical protein AAGD11_15350 [Planctomycetota bacterium]